MEQVFKVRPEHGADRVQSGNLPVLATPVLISFMEQVANQEAQTRVTEGQTSVGIHIDMHHLKASAIGSEIRVVVNFMNLQEGRINYSIEAYEGEKLIGKADHQRAIVSIEKFMARL